MANDQNSEPVAIVGISCRLPKARNLDEFWSIINSGEDAMGTAPPGRWEQKDYPYPILDSCKTMNAGFLSNPVEHFDAAFFGISPMEATFMDPQARMLLEVAWEAIEDAGINSDTLKNSNTGVFAGSWLSDYKDILMHCADYQEFYRTYSGNSIGSAAARISFHLGLVGPCIATESGCSSSMVAVDLACKSLHQKECNLAIACGMNLLLKPFDKDEMPMIISPDGRCKTFDESANGFARAEGVAVLVLKRLPDAITNNDKIWGIIRGSAIAQEGVSKSMGTPTVHIETLAMKLALTKAAVNPTQVSYVEAHGTGTKVGDPMEIQAIANAYHSNDRKEPLIIGSVKTNIGHTEACSGITGILKVLLALKNDSIPAHINLARLNPAIDLTTIPAIIPISAINWPRTEGKPRIAGVSSFGITGTDAHIIIEEPPFIMANSHGNNVDRPFHVIKFSSKSQYSLDLLLIDYLKYFETTKDSLCDVAYTANTGRADFVYRAVMIIDSNENALKQIQKGNLLTKKVQDTSNIRKLCFLFTGQGSQYFGMGKELYECSPIFQKHFDHCSDFLDNNYNIDIKSAIWNEMKEETDRTIYSQTAIFCVAYALTELWSVWGVKPNYVLGHSLGEFVAAVCAGILKVEDALVLVAERSLLIQNLTEGKMLVVAADHKTVNSIMSKANVNLDYAAFNSPGQTVVTGDVGDVLQLENYLQNETDIKCTLLKSSHAFHSKHMDKILSKYKLVCQNIKPNGNFVCGYISALTGELIKNGNELDTNYWLDQTRQPVSFTKACATAFQHCDKFLEIGPSSVLSMLAKANLSHRNNSMEPLLLSSLQKGSNAWKTMLECLSKLYLNGIPIDWTRFDEGYIRKKVRVPHYHFVGRPFWPNIKQRQVTFQSYLKKPECDPLLGIELVNSSSVRFFQNELRLDENSNIAYLGDHKIGKNVIFPATAYLHMILRAGITNKSIYESFVRVKNLEIFVPLVIPLSQESEYVHMETMVEQSETKNNGSSAENPKLLIKISQKIENFEAANSKWLTHARASFEEISMSDKSYIGSELCSYFISTKSETAISSILFYKKLETAGLAFGPRFKSILQYWELPNSLLVELKTSKDLENNQLHNFHPVVLDAMLQSIMLLSNENLRDSTKVTKNLNVIVPIKIGKFVGIPNKHASETSSLFVLVNQEEVSSSCLHALLIDSKGTVYADMSSVQFVETTLRSIQALIEEQGKSPELPDLWEEVWKPQLFCNTQYRVHLDDNLFRETKYSLTPFINTEVPQMASEIDQAFMNLVSYYVIQSFHKLGWNLSPGIEFDQSELSNELCVSTENTGYFDFMLEILKEQRILAKYDTHWKVLKGLPACEIILENISKLKTVSKYITLAENSIQLIEKVGNALAEILKGNISAVSVLFPDASDDLGADSFYHEYVYIYGSDKITARIAETRFLHFKNNSDQRVIIRILEVGAGTGGYTGIILEALDKLDVEYEYTYTDISSSFFPSAEQRLNKYRNNLKFQKLNIEEDPLEQGFAPQYYDIIYAFEVIHATRSIAETLQNIRKLLREGGHFETWETTRNDAHFLTFIFGLLPGYWRFQDKQLRGNRCYMNQASWEYALKENGFEITKVFPGHMNTSTLFCCRPASIKTILLPQVSKTWLVFPYNKISNDLVVRLSQIGRSTIRVLDSKQKQITSNPCETEAENTFSVNLNSEEEVKRILYQIANQENRIIEGVLFAGTLKQESDVSRQLEIMQQFFYITKNIEILRDSVRSYPLRAIVLTQGISHFEDKKNIGNIYAGTLLGYSRSLYNEMGSMIACYFLDINNYDQQQAVDQILYEMFGSSQNNIQTIFQDGTKYLSKLQICKSLPKGEGEIYPPITSDRFQLILSESRSIDDLKFDHLISTELGDNEVELAIKCVSLNFRDILSVLKPTEQFLSMNTVGLDLVGEVVNLGVKVKRWKLGDILLTLNMNNNGPALPSHLNIHEDLAIKVPEQVTFCDAVTLPAVFSTAYKCLVEVAKLKKTDKVLIHAAAGGVGLVAIQLCKNIVSMENIIVTAGSNRKRNYLEGIGVRHIFNSRSTEFSEKILKLTKGQGIDVVLNSLTSGGFKEATLKCCSYGARFIEMSKMNVWTVEEVQQKRPDIKYGIVDVSAAGHGEIKFLLKQLSNGLINNMIKSLPFIRFDAVRIRQAMQYFQKAKHIGKVVLVMPERKYNADTKSYEWFTPLFNNRSSYLVTGGLGGIGFELGKWMVTQGAKHVVLAGRKSAKPDVLSEIQRINKEKESCIITTVLDVSSMEDCISVFGNKFFELGLPPLKGIMHAAGILADGLIVNQDWQKWSAVFNSKVMGTINLHNITANLNLEHFVLFSSFVAQLGSPGQSNHAAANQFEDSFAHYRNSVGLPATTINWGNWCEVGVATKIDFSCLRPITTKQGLAALNYILRQNRLQTMVANLEDFELMERLFPRLYSKIDERFLSKNTTSKSFTSGTLPMLLTPDQFWGKYATKHDMDEKILLIKEQVRCILYNVLRMSPNDDNFGDDTGFESIGVDSLMFVEIKNSMQSVLGSQIVITEGILRERNTVALISDTIFQQINEHQNQ